MTKFDKIMNFALVSVTFVLFIIFVIYTESPDERDWKPLAYGAAVIFFFFLVHEGLKIFTKLPPKIDIILFLFQIVLSFVLLIFSILQNITIFIAFSILLLIVFILSMFLEYKKVS